MKFEPGHPKLPNSGRKRGVKNKKTEILNDRLQELDCDLYALLAEALLAKDVEMAKVLKSILELVVPRPTPQPLAPPPEPDTPNISVAEAVAALTARPQ